MTAALPHDPYATAVIEALAAVGLGPDDAWTQAAADPAQLEIFLQFGDCRSINPPSTSAAVSRSSWPHGLVVAWNQYDGWQYCDVGGKGAARELISDLLPPPAAVVAALQLLLPRRTTELPLRWDPEATWQRGHVMPLQTRQLLYDVRAAVDAWTASHTTGATA